MCCKIEPSTIYIHSCPWDTFLLYHLFPQIPPNAATPRTRLVSSAHASQQNGTANTLWAPNSSSSKQGHGPAILVMHLRLHSQHNCQTSGIHRPWLQLLQQKRGKPIRNWADLPQQCSVTADLSSDMTRWRTHQAAVSYWQNLLNLIARVFCYLHS